MLKSLTGLQAQDGCVMPESRFLSLAIFVKCKYQTLFNKYSV